MTTTVLHTRPQARPARFTDTVASEWSKLFSLRSTYITLALGLVLSLGMTALVAFATGSTYQDWEPAAQASFEPFMFSLVGMVFGGIVYSVFGVLAATGEYSTGMIRLTLAATPRRWRVFWAKVLLVTIVLLVFTAVTVGGMFLFGQAILDSYGMPTASLANPDVRRALVGLAVTGPYFPLMGLALGFLLRSTAGAITAVLAMIWLPEMFGGLLPMWWRENVLSRLPGPALDSAVVGHIVESPAFGDPIVGAAVAAAWLAGLLAIAYIAFARRDA